MVERSVPLAENDAEPLFSTELDAMGLTCPLPILRAKKALAKMESGQILRIVTTDRNAIRDFQAFAQQTGNRLVAQRALVDCCVHFLQRR